jgi:hypothetical protein
LKTLSERGNTGLSFWIALGNPHEYTDAPHLLGLLRPCSQWPRSRATQYTEKIAPLHAGPLALDEPSLRLKGAL